jgi:hypothetical protein
MEASAPSAHFRGATGAPRKSGSHLVVGRRRERTRPGCVPGRKERRRAYNPSPKLDAIAAPLETKRSIPAGGL